MKFQPGYLRLLESGELEERTKKAYQRLSACDLCPHHCGVNRLKEEKGFCRSGSQAVVSSFGSHFGEEEPLVGIHGSGTIFFTFCNMRCIYCQNYEISWLGVGKPVTSEELAAIMLQLQNRYHCHNINLVTPTHFVPQILEAVKIAAEEGLQIPLVYNCGGYEELETLKLLEGIIDIYMPDLKYDDPEIARKYSGIKDYPKFAKLAIKEMYRQVGNLLLDEQGIALRGLIVRHLVLPGGLAGTEGCMKFLASISTEIFVNVMGQYRPENRAFEYPPLNRRITAREYQEAVSIAKSCGLTVPYRL
ncbi:MAG: Radical SAM domain protein [Thermoanaerobacterales bacterium 50_218]|nr:MAG: Radical SAM domain protein [Thermoanaerobacterales bacterium 50_218]HAA89452.1 radical SAM protein [Peptococcaceae bacterium]